MTEHDIKAFHAGIEAIVLQLKKINQKLDLLIEEQRRSGSG